MAVTKEQAQIKSIRGIMRDIDGARETLDALALIGREDANALQMLSKVLDGAFCGLDDVVEALEKEQATQ